MLSNKVQKIKVDFHLFISSLVNYGRVGNASEVWIRWSVEISNKAENYTLSKLALCMVIDTAGFLLDQKIHRGWEHTPSTSVYGGKKD